MHLFDRYGLVPTTVSINARRFDLLLVEDLDRLFDEVDAEDPDERYPYWAELWPSAVALCRVIDQTVPDADGALALELGAGYGLPSLLLAKKGYRVIAVDYLPQALSFLEGNARQNGIPTASGGPGSISPVCGDIRALPLSCRFDLVVASDVVYERRFFEPVERALSRMKEKGGTVLLSEPCRTLSQGFFGLLDARGWSRTATRHLVVHRGANVEVDVHRLGS